MRPASLLRLSVVAALALAGCAAGQLHRPAGGFYRVPGMAPTPMPFSPDEGAQSFRLEPGGRRVEVVLEAALVDGEIRLITAIDNASREQVRYDLKRATLSTSDGTPLELAGISEDPSRRPSARDRAGEAYRAGVREMVRGERSVVTRRYRLKDPDDPDAARLLAHLELVDEIAVGERTEPIQLRLDRVR